MKVFKKILAAALSVSLLAGFGTAAAVSADDASDRPLIGVMFYSNTDALGSQTYALVNKAAETLGADTLWEVGNFDNDSQLNAIQNLIAAGIDGLIFQPMDYDFLEKVIDVCEDAGVYLGVMFGPIQDEDTIEYLSESDYYVGYSHEDEKGNAKKLIDILHEEGRTNLGVGFATPGQTLADLANAGFREGIEEYGMNVLAEYSNPIDNNVNTVTSNVQNFLSAFADIDCMAFGGMGGGAGEAIARLLVDSGRDVKIVGRDIFVGMDETFEKGVGAAYCGAVAPDGLYMLSCVYNAVVGTPISEEPVHLVQPALFVTSSENCEFYNNYVADTENYSTIVYDEEFYKSLSKADNPDLTEESMQAMMDEYSFEWIAERVG